MKKSQENLSSESQFPFTHNISQLDQLICSHTCLSSKRTFIWAWIKQVQEVQLNKLVFLLQKCIM